MLFTGQQRAQQNNNRAFFGALFALLAFLVYLRSAELSSALPYFKYVDEGHVLQRVAHMLRTHSLDPGWYRYPPLTMYAVLVVSLLSGNAHVPPAHALYDIIEPSSLIFWGRVTVFGFYLSTVLLTALAARRLAGNAAGLSAAICAASIPALALRSTMVIVDTVACFFSAGVLYVLALQQAGQHSSRMNFAGGLLSGLACAAKYPAGALVLSLYRRPFTATAGGFLFGLALGMPPLLWRLPEILKDVRAQAAIYAVKLSPVTYLQAALDPVELGIPFLSLCSIAFVVFICKRPQRNVFYRWAAFACSFLAALLSSKYQPFRNILPLIPFLCVMTGCALANALQRWNISANIQLLLAPFVLLGICRNFIPDREPQIVDSRTEALHWIRSHAKPSDSLLMSELIGFHPEELRTLENPLETQVEKSSIVILPGTDTRARRGAYTVLAKFGDREANYAPNVWRTNDQLIVLLKPSGAGAHTVSRAPFP